MGNLLLNQIFNNSSSGTVTLSIPLFDSNTQKGSRISVKGFLTSDPSIQFRNQWGSILPDDTSINEVMNLVGSKSLAAWVSSSSAGLRNSFVHLLIKYYLPQIHLYYHYLLHNHHEH